MSKKETKQTKLKSPTLLSYEKKLVPSYGEMFGTTWDQRHSEEHCTPLSIEEKSVKGTMSNRLKGKDVDKEVSKSNLQRVDSCTLTNGNDTLKVAMTLKVLSGVGAPSNCNSTEFINRCKDAVATYADKHGFTELAYRYAYNIASARFLWKNRVGVEALEVNVKCKGLDETLFSFTFDGKSFVPNEFREDKDISELANMIADVLSGKRDFMILSISAYARVGVNQDVYPSEELVLDKGNKERSKVLAALNGNAVIHSQKIGNALRTIDTWYPDHDILGVGPIPVEVYGTKTDTGTAYRHPTGTKKDFYSILDRFAKEGNFECDEDAHYFMAILIRGGVFGGSKE